MREAYGGRAPAAKITGRSLLPKVLPGVHSKAGEGGVMALQRWPSLVEVRFTEVRGEITATIRHPDSGRTLAKLLGYLPVEIIRRVRAIRELHGAEALFPRPWPTTMEKFFRQAIAETRRKMAEAVSDIEGGEQPAKGRMNELKAQFESLKEPVAGLDRVVRMQQEMINLLHATVENHQHKWEALEKKTDVPIN